MDEQILQKLEAVVKNVINSTEGILGWEWDGRFYGALAQFEGDQTENILNVLEENFGPPWTVENIDKADEIVLIISDFTGGLRPGQKLFTTCKDDDPLVFVAYWPWGDGSNVSIRMIPTGQNVSGDDMSNLVKQFKTWANV